MSTSNLLNRDFVMRRMGSLSSGCWYQRSKYIIQIS